MLFFVTNLFPVIQLNYWHFVCVFQGFCSGWAIRGYDLSNVEERFPHFLCHLHDFCDWIFTG